MNPDSPTTIYAMAGPMGSGKTTLALKIASKHKALFQTLDGTIKAFNEPIEDLKGYESLMPKALDLMFSKALEALQSGQSVVFDVGRWPWLMQLADAADSKIEIYNFQISAEERWRRVQKCNNEKPKGVFHWTMSKAEFDTNANLKRSLPPAMPGLKIITIFE